MAGYDDNYTTVEKPSAPSYTIVEKSTAPSYTIVPKPWGHQYGLLTEAEVELITEAGETILIEY